MQRSCTFCFPAYRVLLHVCVCVYVLGAGEVTPGNANNAVWLCHAGELMTAGASCSTECLQGTTLIEHAGCKLPHAWQDVQTVSNSTWRTSSWVDVIQGECVYPPVLSVQAKKHGQSHPRSKGVPMECLSPGHVMYAKQFPQR
jgi:hypothetical protein